MVDLTPTAPVKGAGTSSNTSAQNTDDNIKLAPAKVVSVPPGLIFNGGTITIGARLAAANADGSLTLRTAAGDLTIRTTVNIPVNMPLQVQLTPGNPPSALLILAHNNDITHGNVPATVPPQLAEDMDLPALADTTATLRDQPGDLPPLGLGTVTRALVLNVMSNLAMPTVSPMGAMPGNAPQLADQLETMLAQQGAAGLDPDQLQLLSQSITSKLPTQVGPLNISVRMLETVQQTLRLLEVPGSAGQGDAHALSLLMQLMGDGKTKSASLPLQTILPALPQEKLPDGSQLQLRLVKIMPPGNSQDMLKQLSAAGPLLEGVVSSQQINGQPVVQTLQGNLLLPNLANLPVGTKLVFEIVPPAAHSLAGAAPAVALPALTADVATARSWPQLAAALQEVGNHNQDVLRALLGSMPRLNAQLPVNALFFLQALRTGNLRNWLGEKGLDILRRSGAAGVNLLAGLEEDFKTLSRNMTKTQSGDWKNYPIPIMGEQGVQLMQINVRDHFQPIHPDDKQDRPEDYARSTRFLVDMEFSELGALQIDGLLRPTEYNNKQLDIILRTPLLLPQELRRDLRAVYDGSLETHGLKGALSFQAGFQNWVKLAHSAAHRYETI